MPTVHHAFFVIAENCKHEEGDPDRCALHSLIVIRRVCCFMVSGLFHIVIHVSGSAYIKYINSVNTLPNPADDEGCS